MKKILIVEDELAYAKLLTDQLESRSYAVTTASDGEDGLAKAKAENPDLILLDIRMPKMDGLTMLSLLHKHESGKTAKTIMLTNLEPDDRIMKEVMASQPSYYFIKSDTKLENIIRKIDELLSE